MAQTVILRGTDQRALAKRLIDAAPVDAVVTVKEATRNADQNALMWALLSDISRAKPEGRRHTPEIWKALFMAACGHEVQFAAGLDGNPFPVGFRSSRLTVRQMADLITFIQAWGDERGVIWHERNRYEDAA
jgi:hypothetical protein